MKKFISKIILFLAIFSFSAIALFTFDYLFIGNQYTASYQASLIYKVSRLKKIDEPKIVLIGNSNLAFGIDSAQIEQAFGMPVVNMGLHGGLGNAFHEDMAKMGVSADDIVIVCHADYNDEDKILEPNLAWITIEKHRELWPLIRTKDIPSMLKAYPDYFRKCLKNYNNNPRKITIKESVWYSSSVFNEYGDVRTRDESSYVFNEQSVKVSKISAKCIKRLNNLNKYIKNRGAVMLVAGYPIGYGEFTPPASEFDAFEQELRSRLDCEVISHYTDYFIPYEYFLDTALHLTEEGADIRTKQLIADLDNWMKNK